jgi:sodium-independent sulfate anion transporter 11
MTTERAEEIFIDYEHTTYKEETELFFKNLPHYTRDYLVALLPIASWIRRYNLMVLYGR